MKPISQTTPFVTNTTEVSKSSFFGRTTRLLIAPIKVKERERESLNEVPRGDGLVNTWPGDRGGGSSRFSKVQQPLPTSRYRCQRNKMNILKY